MVFQMFIRHPQNTKCCFILYFLSEWNWLDLMAQISIATSAGVRMMMDAKDFHTARGMYAIALNFAFLRIINIFYASSELGPLVIIIRDMVSNKQCLKSVRNIYTFTLTLTSFLL